MNKKRSFLGAGAVFALLVVAVVLLLLRSSAMVAPPMEKVTITYLLLEPSALFMVAQDQGMFARRGLDLSVTTSPTGGAALQEIHNGQVDLAVNVSEFPMVNAIFAGENEQVVAVVDKAELFYLVTRPASGIRSIADLPGKRVGTVTGTITDFFLGRLLDLRGMKKTSIDSLAFNTFGEAATALEQGTVDAAVLTQPYALQARDRLGLDAQMFSVQSGQQFFALVVARRDWIEAHPETLRRFLAALRQADEFVQTRPEAAWAIVQKRLSLGAGYESSFVRQNQFGLSLDQSLVAAMEDEARWLIQNHLVESAKVPDFTDYISEETLRALQPESVNILR